MVDVAYCWYGWKEALRVLRHLEEYDIFFVETPLPSDDLAGYAKLADATQIGIAAGEWLQIRFEFAELMERGGVDIVQLDIGRLGGITEAVRPVQMALYRGKIVVPYCWKTGISVAATAFVAAVAPNCHFIEVHLSPVAYSRLRRELVEEELKVVNGKIPLPQRLGLGFELRLAAFAEFAAVAEQNTRSARVLFPEGARGWNSHD